jgi:hypothetical protein
MNRLFLSLAIAASIGLSACGGSKTAATNNNSTNTTNKTTTENKSTPTTATAGEASAVVKDIYDNAMKRNCSAIPPMLTEDFKKAVGTGKDELDALCDSITDSGKLTSFEIKGETLTNDSGKVKVALTYKDGKKEEKEENVKKSNGKWLMDS